MHKGLYVALFVAGFAVYYFWGSALLIIIMLSYILLLVLEVLSTVEEAEKKGKVEAATAWEHHQEIKQQVQGVDDRLQMLFSELFPSPAELERRKENAAIETMRQGLINRFGLPPE